MRILPGCPTKVQPEKLVAVAARTNTHKPMVRPATKVIG